ncbi:hypothetical protein B0T19DRAFT_455576 [Cercophora scortea]|uniref:Uncharacterized protein n=1 Tax=Cercophora scortea TaxID=314031 RepID=A0AAE0J6W5_9PEZI|nr:hypothetical protein B0T19DRAFT_455576 [Cercophora scortea]
MSTAEADAITKPGFVLLETAIPYEQTARFLLGCVVGDIRNPTDDYQPEGHYYAFQKYTLEVFDMGYKAFVAAQQNRSFEARLDSLVGLDTDKVTKVSDSLQSTIVRTKILMQHPKIQESLMGSPASKQKIVSLMKRNGGKGFLIVGFKSALDAKHTHSISLAKKVHAQIETPVDKIIEWATHGAIHLGEAVNPKVSFKDENGQAVDVESTMAGERIIAVRYRLLTLHGWFDKDCDLGEVIRVAAGGGVFGADEEGDGLIFDGEDVPAVPEPEKLEIPDEEIQVDISPRQFEEDLDILGYRNNVDLIY